MSAQRDERPERSMHERARAAEARLRTVERRFQSTVARIADGILVVDASGRIRFSNPAGERIFGRPAADLVGTELGIPVMSDETTQVDLQTPAGPRLVELRVVSTTWEDKDALLVSMRDITEQREAQVRERHLLMEQLARLQAEQEANRASLLADAGRLLASTRDEDTMMCDLAKLVAERVADVCLIDISADPGTGRYRKVVAVRRDDGGAEVTDCVESDQAGPALSALVRRLHASRSPERVVRPDAGWIAGASSDPEDETLWRKLKSGTVVVAPLVSHTGPLGVLAISANRRAQLAERDDGLVGDLAHRTSLAFQNARLLERAEEASRAKSDFLAIISHELRTPLTGITGYASLLTEQIERPLTQREMRYAEGILRCSDRLLGIIDQILLFARSRSAHEVVQRSSISLRRLLDDVARVVRPLAEEASLALVVRPPSPDVTVNTDAAIVRHILVHLLNNAVKFTREGSVTLEGEGRDGHVILRVADTGRGIDPEKVRQVFEPFRQAEAPHTREVGGTGIGLNVVQNLVRLLGGELDFVSEPGRGTTFTVRLPAM